MKPAEFVRWNERWSAFALVLITGCVAMQESTSTTTADPASDNGSVDGDANTGLDGPVRSGDPSDGVAGEGGANDVGGDDAGSASDTDAGPALGSTEPDAGGSAGGGSGSGGPTQGSSCPQAKDLFASSVQASLDMCRLCHVPDGVADVERGKKFMLSDDESTDFANVKAAWVALGGNNPTSRILTMASGAESHSGGAVWKPTSTAYKNMAKVLRLFADPNDCD